MIRAILILLALAACSSTPKAARKWEDETVRNRKEKMLGTLVDTGGGRPGTVVFGHGLLDDVQSPGRSKYDTQGIVETINATGFKNVLTLGYESTLLEDGAGALLGKSDVAFMLGLKEGPQSVHQYYRELARLIGAEELSRPVVGIGISMGGSNLLTVAMQYPEMFDGMVLLNPMIMRPDAWKRDFDFDLEKFDFSRGLENLDARLMPGNHFDESEWREGVNPFTQLERAQKLPRMLVTACRQDEFKLFDATLSWVLRAKELGHDVTWIPNENCKHTEPRTAEVPEFLR